MAFTWTAAVGLVALGFGVGAFGTLVGAGGGFILTPILLLLYPDDSPQTLTAISLTAVFFNAASGSVAYFRQRRTDYRSGLAFALATLPGAIGGALVVQTVSRKPFDAAVAGVLGVIGVWLLAGERFPLRAPPGGRQRRLVDREGHEYAYRVALWRGVAFSLVVGFVSSFLGIGGGVVHVPVLVSVLGFPTHVATATSHFVLAIMSGAATVTHALSGSFHGGHGLRRAAALSIGVVVGAQLGARISLRTRGRIIELLLAAALLGLAARLLVGLL